MKKNCTEKDTIGNRKPHILMSIAAITCCAWLLPWLACAAQQVPANLFNIGDSIGEAEAADGVIGSHHHDKVWSTGYDRDDQVNSFNERFAASCPTIFESNTETREPVFNQAVTGADMSDFSSQAEAVIRAAASTSSKKAGMITVYPGNNDACADTISEMSSATEFEANYRAGLDILAAASETRNAQIVISSLMDS